MNVGSNAAGRIGANISTTVKEEGTNANTNVVTVTNINKYTERSDSATTGVGSNTSSVKITIGDETISSTKTGSRSILVTVEPQVKLNVNTGNVNKDGDSNNQDTIGAKSTLVSGESDNTKMAIDTAASGDTSGKKSIKTTANPVNSTNTSEVSGNVSIAASDAGTNSSTAASGIRANVSTTASETGTNSSATMGGVKPNPTGVLNSSANEGINLSIANKMEKWRHSIADCLACVPTRPPSSHELREAFFADMEGSIESRNVTSPVPERSPQAEVLHHVHFMANPIHLRQTRSALLSLKQRHPDVFRSPCVYSDVCALLSRDTYMLCARRFVQELFLDANFECFAGEPAAILSRHVITTSPVTTTTQ